jgi:hypothetical protein
VRGGDGVRGHGLSALGVGVRASRGEAEMARGVMDGEGYV